LRFYRAYNPNADFHFFTSRQAEFNFVVSLGNHDETTGKPGFALATAPTTGDRPVYRLYNLHEGRHYYTYNAAERDYLVSLSPPPGDPNYGKYGWRYERDEGFLFTFAYPGTEEVFRLYNNNSGTHLFTSDPHEKDAILATFPGIWVQHSSLGFAFPVSAAGTFVWAPTTSTSQAQQAVRSAELVPVSLPVAVSQMVAARNWTIADEETRCEQCSLASQVASRTLLIEVEPVTAAQPPNASTDPIHRPDLPDLPALDELWRAAGRVPLPIGFASWSASSSQGW
jgi:hypothetical protein